MGKISPKEYISFKANPVLAMIEFAKKIQQECQDQVAQIKTEHEKDIKMIVAETMKTIDGVKTSALKDFSGLTVRTAFETLEGNLTQITNEIAKKVKIPQGKDGEPGKDGTTPKEGVDYPSKKQIKEIVKENIAAEISISINELENTFKNKENIFAVKLEAVMKDIKKDFPKFELKGEDIVKEINNLPITPDKQIDAKHIKNLPKAKEEKGSKRLGRGTSNPIQYYDLTSQCNGVLKTFSIPTNTKVLALYGTQFPVIFRPLIDWTATSTTISLTSEVAAPEEGQTLFILYVE